MGGGEGSKGNLKNEDGEHVVVGLEPDPRYIRCCSKVCRPGHALRDALLGLLVLLGLSVIVTVIFVVCFYVVPDEKQLIDEGILPGNAEGVIGGPGGVNEITLRDGDKYTLPPHNFDDTSGSSQDFNTFTSSTDDTFRDTTDRVLPPHSENSDEPASSDFTHSEGVDDESGSLHDLEPRENLDGHLPAEDSNSHHFNEDSLHEDGAHHNLGHPGERPVLEGEHEEFHGDGNTELPVAPVDDRESEAAALPPANIEHTCSAVQLPMCVSSVPWTQAGHPNWLNHTSEGEMFAALPYVRSSLLDSGCSDLAPLYACSVLEPPCSDTAVLPPCRSFCAEVAESCHPFVQRTSLPGLFDCDRFPDSEDPSVCISAQQECSGEDDFRCVTTGLCVPKSWLCDGADDCRDNSDEQNCQLTSPDGPAAPLNFVERGSQRPANQDAIHFENYPQETEYEDSEYSDPSHVGREKPHRGSDVPPFAYQEFDSNDPSTYNDPVLAGPSLNDPSLLEAAYRTDGGDSNPQLEISGERPISEDNQFSNRNKFENENEDESLPNRRYTGDVNVENADEGVEGEDNIQHPVLQGARPYNPRIEERDPTGSAKDQISDYSIRSDHFQNHPIPDVDYPAQETFSVDSTSSVNANYHSISDDRVEEESLQTRKEAGEEGTTVDENVNKVKTPSQRLRERLTGVNRRRQRPETVSTKRTRPTIGEISSDDAESEAVDVTIRPTRPPSRLVNFQERFREWRDKRRPTLPSDLENLRPSRTSTRAPSSSDRPYNLVRRRPQRITTPQPELSESGEISRKPSRETFENAEYDAEIDQPSNIGQPITLPESVVPEPDYSNSENSDDQIVDDNPGSAARPFNRFRPGFRMRQQQRQRLDRNQGSQQRELEAVPERDSFQQRIADNTVGRDESRQEIHEIIPERENFRQVIPDQVLERENIELPISDNIPERENYRQSISDGPDRDIFMQPIPNSPERNDFRKTTPDDSEYGDYSESIPGIPEHGAPQLQIPEDISERESFRQPIPDDTQERESLQPVIPDDQSAHGSFGQPEVRNDDYISDATYDENEPQEYSEYEVYESRQNSGEEEPYRPPEYRPQRPYVDQRFQENSPQASQRDSYFPPPRSNRPQFESDSSPSREFELPSNFRNFPPPRANPSHQPRQYQQPATSSSFYNREDAIVSDQHYDVPGINQQRFPSYHQQPLRRQDAYVDPYSQQRP